MNSENRQSGEDGALKQVFKETGKTCFELYRIMVPIIIVVKILQHFELVKYIAWLLHPLMRLVGLPAEMGLVWATAMLTSIYGGMAVLVVLIKDCPMTSAQLTILGCVMLLAHALPLEGQICRKAGPRFSIIVLLRVCGALAFGVVLNLLFSGLQILQGPGKLMWQPSARKLAIHEWLLSQLYNLLWISLIIFVLIGFMKLMKYWEVTELIERLLKPLLGPLGIGNNAANLTTIGMVLGLSYGGGLILNEVRQGHLRKREILYSLVLMGFCHSVIEDSLLVMAIGADFVTIFFGRILFSMVAVWGLVRLTAHLPRERFEQLFYTKQWCQQAELSVEGTRG